MFKKIVVPLDGTAESNVALPLARAMAQSTGGAIWLLRVAPISGLPEDHTGTHEAAQYIQRIADELGRGGLEVHPVTREGDPSQEILHVCSETGADVIVMRTHGRAGFERAVFGSVAEQVLKKTTVPLAVVRPGGRRVSHIQKLLLSVDGSPGGSVALQTAVDIGKTTAASINVLQVVVPVPMLAYLAPYDYSGAALYDAGWDDDALVAARTYVDAVAARLHGLGLPAEAEARFAPNVARAIVDAAEQAETDLIVISTDALTGAARALLGSVADAVVRSSPCPVLLVKRSDKINGMRQPQDQTVEPR